MMKVYTGCIASLLEEHCNENGIIYPEHAGAKKGMWGCTDQLLINKVVLDEVRKYRRNLCTIWLDYKKAYDSVPFQWILKALCLAKVPEFLIRSIETLMGGRVKPSHQKRKHKNWRDCVQERTPARGLPQCNIVYFVVKPWVIPTE